MVEIIVCCYQRYNNYFVSNFSNSSKGASLKTALAATIFSHVSVLCASISAKSKGVLSIVPKSLSSKSNDFIAPFVDGETTST